MKIALRVMGDGLFSRLTKEIAAQDSAFPRRLGNTQLVSWQLERLEPPFRLDHLDSEPNQSAVALVEIQDAAQIEMLWDFGRLEYPSLCHRSESDLLPVPLILVFDDHASAPTALDIPKLVSDWVCGKDAMSEVARRVVTALRRQNSLFDELGLGMLTLNQESRRLIYLGDVMQLSPAEVPLTELFISHMGSLVPMDEILLMFKLAGRASTGSNIRVTIFQLRFKIELVSRNHLTIMCSYSEGYALRPGKGPPRVPEYLEARQTMAPYQA
jgi:DNA-binding response OmpR family regulator